MEIIDLEFDTLRHIFRFVALSGGENLARAVTVCKVFRKLGNERDILKCAVFSNISVSDNVHLFQQFNGVLRKAAEAGSMTARFLLAKIILMSSTQLLVPPPDIEDDFFSEDQSSSDLSYVSDDEISDACTIESEDEDEDEDDNEKETQASNFLSDFESANSETSSKSLHHYHFVRMFWANCSPHDLSEMNLALHCYYMYFADSVSYVNSLFSKFIGTAEKLSNFLKGMEELQKYRHGLMESDNQEVETMEGPSHEQHHDIGYDFVIKCRRFGKSLQKLKNERPNDKEFTSIIDGQFEEYKVCAETLTSAFEELRVYMLPVIDRTFCDYMEIDPYVSSSSRTHKDTSVCILRQRTAPSEQKKNGESALIN